MGRDRVLKGRQRRGLAAVVAGVGVGSLGLGGCDLGAPPTGYDVQGGLVASDDVDGDGDVDLVVNGADGIAVLLGDGAGGFSVVSDQDDDSGFEATVGDANGDGAADLFVSREVLIEPLPPEEPFARVVVRLRLADGAGGFGPPMPALGFDRPYDTAYEKVVVGDVTDDGHVDVVLVDALAREVVVRPGDGTGGFGADVVSGPLRANVAPTALLHDLDGDGHLDLAVAGACLAGTGELLARGCVDVLAGTGTGTFASARHLDVEDPEVDTITSLAAGDFDGDGHVDLVGGNQGNSFDGGGPVGSLSVFSGDGTGGFGPETSLPAHAQTTRVAVGDLDGDGHLDLVTGLDTAHAPDDPGYSRVLFGDGEGRFPDLHLLERSRGPIVVDDLDADGVPDVALGNGEGVAVYLNRWDG